MLHPKLALLFGQVHVGLDKHVDLSWLDVFSAKAPSNGEYIPLYWLWLEWNNVCYQACARRGPTVANSE